MHAADRDAFTAFDMHATTSADIDRQLATDELTCVFLWGDDCYNCDIAKGQMLLHESRVASLPVRWLHANVYRDAKLRDRFALHGVPAFFFFRAGKRLGRITGWPGIDAFCKAVLGLTNPPVAT
ncbi:MAG TPA: thioredoxin family protein [Burkholderiaceae bacterium]|nr:thioredoxin family protein [Burkholderiaceae bacterium]